VHILVHTLLKNWPFWHWHQEEWFSKDA